MNTVDTIRDPHVVARVCEEARKLGEQPYMLMRVGFNTGLRISDILKLRVRDIRAEQIRLKEQKTGYAQMIELHPAVRAELMRMTAKKGEDELLFPSPQITKGRKPIGYTTAYGWINKAARRAGLTGPIGCHTMRKAFGYRYYIVSGGDVALLMKRFGHTDQTVTLRYIGVEQDRINAIGRKINLG